jgi:hypothetical protein
MNIQNILKNVLVAVAVLFPLKAKADLPGKHPFYLHALTDLRTARWMLEHRPGDPAVSGQEDVAIQQIDAAIGDIKAASIDDGKDLHDHPKIDLPKRHEGHLHKALDLLRKVRQDVSKEEDDPLAKGLKKNALNHINGAIGATKDALEDAHKAAK